MWEGISIFIAIAAIIIPLLFTIYPDKEIQKKIFIIKIL